jgi:hypothetical protein
MADGFRFPLADTLPLFAENEPLLLVSESAVKLALQSPFFGQ